MGAILVIRLFGLLIGRKYIENLKALMFLIQHVQAVFILYRKSIDCIQLQPY